MRQLIVAGDAPSIVGVDSLNTVFEEPLLDPEQDGKPAAARQILRRMTYLLNQEFPECPLGFIGLSAAYRSMRQLVYPDAHVIEAYLDCEDVREMRLYRFLMYNLGLVKDWEKSSDAELFRSISEVVDQYPDCMIDASTQQLARFKHRGVLSLSFGDSSA